MARPTILTPALSNRILASLQRGVPLSVAAEAAGVHRDTVYGWLERAKAAQQSDEPLTEADSAYVEFSDAHMRATAQGVELLHMLVAECAHGYRPSKKEKGKLVKSKMSPLRLQSAQWLLARRFPEHYGQHRESVVTAEVSPGAPSKDGGNGLTVKVIVANVAADEDSTGTT